MLFCFMTPDGLENPALHAYPKPPGLNRKTIKQIGWVKEGASRLRIARSYPSAARPLSSTDFIVY
jgi:hypothetical protein